MSSKHKKVYLKTRHEATGPAGPALETALLVPT